jgi:trigger factor
MQVSVEHLGPLQRRLRVEVPEEQIASEVQNRLKSLSRTTRIDGFRPGKVPYKLLQQRFGSRVRAEVIGETVQHSFYEAVTQEQLRPAGTPQIEPLQTEAGAGLTYTATFEVYPEVKLAAIEQLEIERPVCEIGEADIDRMIEVLRKQQRQLEPVDRPVAAADVAVVDFTGRIDGEVFEGGQAEDFQVEISARRLIPGFEEGLVGAAPGQTLTLNLAFPDDYQRSDLAGRPVEFEVTVKEVREPKLPALDADFFEAFGAKGGGEEAFRAEVRRNMAREAEQTVRGRLKEAVMDALHKAHEVALPDALVETEQQRLLEQARAQLQQYGASREQLEGIRAETYAEQARKRVSLQLIVSELIKVHEVKIEPGEVRSLIEKSAAGYEDPEAVVNWYYSDRSRLAEVEALVMEDKLVDWIVSQAKVTEKPLTFDALMNKGQTE